MQGEKKNLSGVNALSDTITDLNNNVINGEHLNLNNKTNAQN